MFLLHDWLGLGLNCTQTAVATDRPIFGLGQDRIAFRPCWNEQSQTPIFSRSWLSIAVPLPPTTASVAKFKGEDHK